MRQDLILQQLTDAYADSAFVPRTVAERVARLAEQQREVSQFDDPARTSSRARSSSSPRPPRNTTRPIAASSTSRSRCAWSTSCCRWTTLMKQVQVDPAEVAKYYEARRAQFEKAETQARHILIAVDPNAGAGGEAEGAGGGG